MVYQAPLAFLDPLDPPDHAVYLMDQMPWVLGLKTWTAMQTSSGVLLVHRALQDLLVPLDPTCPHLPPLKDFLLGMLDHLVHLAVMAFKANKEYQVQQEKLVLQVHLGLQARRVSKAYLGLLGQRVKVGQRVSKEFQGLKGLLVQKEREAFQAHQDLLAHQGLQEPNSLQRIWRDLA